MPNDAADMWSEGLQELTRKMLLDDNAAFPLPNGKVGLALKHVDGRFGYINVFDLAYHRWHIRPMREDEGDWEEIFDEVDDLIASGWAVD